MNKEEVEAHFKQRVEDMAITMELIKQTRTLNSTVAQLLCAISYDIALMFQYQLEKESST